MELAAGLKLYCGTVSIVHATDWYGEVSTVTNIASSDPDFHNINSNIHFIYSPPGALSSPRGLVPHKNRGVTGDYGVNDEIVITSKLLVNCSLFIVNC